VKKPRPACLISDPLRFVIGPELNALFASASSDGHALHAAALRIDVRGAAKLSR